jgi:hypothetical protein
MEVFCSAIKFPTTNGNRQKEVMEQFKEIAVNFPESVEEALVFLLFLPQSFKKYILHFLGIFMAQRNS